MRQFLGPAAALLAALASTDLSAKESLCSLLSAADIRAVTGSAAGDSRAQETPIETGPAKGQTMSICHWTVAADQGTVNVNVLPALTGPNREAGLASLRAANDRLRAMHWTEEKKDFGGVRCSIMTPPQGEQKMPISAACMGEAKGKAIGVGFMSPTRKLTLAQIKALYDQAVARLE